MLYPTGRGRCEVDVERRYRESWVIPQICCSCGEPVVDGKPYVASVTLATSFKMTGGTSAETASKWISASFPRCARCVRATSLHSNAQGIGGLVGVVFGIVGIAAALQLTGGWLWGCATGLIVLGAVAAGSAAVIERVMGRSFDEDMWRRTKLSSSPVMISKASKRETMPDLRFVFADDAYGEAFSEANL